MKERFSVNVLNLLNQAAVTNTTQAINRSGFIQISAAQFFKGFDVNQYLQPAESSVPPARNPIYTLPSAYQGNREVRFGFRLLF